MSTRKQPPRRPSPPSTGLPRAGIAPPKFVGMPSTGQDPVVSKYTQGIVERARAAGGAHKVPIPDLAAAAAEYRPEKDGPMTLGQIAEAQENIRTMDNDQAAPKKTLSPETVAGLRALHDQVAAQQVPAPPPTPPPAPEAPVVASSAPAKPEPAKKSVTKLSEDEKRDVAETSDLDFDLMMARLRSDVINNQEERKAVEARLKPMDLSDGLLTGEFKQHVPIYPGKLEVVFRTITPLENEELRRKVLEHVLEDERFANVMGEKYGFMQTVAAVHSLNGQELPKHLTAGDKGGRKFLWDVFEKKVSVFMAYPGPLIHALGTHAYWFDLRVRALFTSAALKNG